LLPVQIVGDDRRIAIEGLEAPLQRRPFAPPGAAPAAPAWAAAGRMAARIAGPAGDPGGVSQRAG